MIEKIPKQNTWGQCLDKINELIDVVNELQLVRDVVFNRIDMLNNAICDMRNATENTNISKMEDIQKALKKICKLLAKGGNK